MQTCRSCSSSSVKMVQCGTHTGLYCADCGAWIKWVGKDEERVLRGRGIKVCQQDVKPTKTVEQAPIVCRHCGSISTVTQQQGVHLGVYCADCGAWIKWAKQPKHTSIKRTSTAFNNL